MKSDAHWKNIGLHTHHGICLPLFSLRSKKSCGIGEFLDLIPLIDWCKSLKFDCIQLLPINDSGHDPSPYNPLSSCALDPIYLSLSDLGINPTSFRELTEQQRVNRQEVLHKKLALLDILFKETFPTLSKTPAYLAFVKDNPWLESYALFKAFKDQFESLHWNQWPAERKEPEVNKKEFYIFLQFHCFSQMEKVHAYATQQGIFIKGDIPILLSPDSADVWLYPNLFKTDVEAGAPPDFYNTLGQNWGFPLFNWDEMRKTNFSWWKQRLKIAERLYHIYRIDHVVGLFRMWGILKGNQANTGSFFPPDSKDWFPQGKEILEIMLESTFILPIAEDLGTIPKEIYPMLKELGICGTKVIRWQRRWDTDFSFVPFEEYEPFSMTTISTPDMEPLALWWSKYPDESIPFAAFMHCSYAPELTHNERFQILRSIHHTTSYFHINMLQEYLALFPELVWSTPEEERINVPGTLLATNWTYRFRPYLEEMISHPELAENFRKIIDKF